MQKLFSHMRFHNSLFINGGHMDVLNAVSVNEELQPRRIFWFPNVDNDHAKLLPHLKMVNPKAMLIMSKVNNGRYSRLDIANRMLQARAMLCLEINTGVLGDGGIHAVFTIHEVLGNSTESNSNPSYVAKKLQAYSDHMMKVERCPSVCVYDAPVIEVPRQSDFCLLNQQNADIFHNIVLGEEPSERFMGNASFRCVKGGFPSFRVDEVVFVSRRNINKVDLTEQGFVAVDASFNEEEPVVRYVGEHKPSVDTPIQLMLYKALPNINYMIHAHVYVAKGLTTGTYFPCGDLREGREILEYFDDGILTRQAEKFAINLKGHGCIIGAKTVDQLRDYCMFIPKPNYPVLVEG